MDDDVSSPVPSDAPARPRDELEEVRELLFGREKGRIERIQERLENPELHARDVGRVLPQAIRLCGSEGDQLARALTPTVESALQESVRRQPSILTNAIFPIIGPAIRRATAEAFGRLMQAVNQALEHSLSVRGLRWRFEAWRTGRSYAEILLVHTLIYRVEQVFLIQRPSGLLLQHVALPDVPARDSDVVSGMLTAIHDFVVDSFRVGPEETLHMLQVGGLSVWIESGPRASIAAVIRGLAPVELRQVLQQSLEQIHRDCGERLGADPVAEEAFADLAPILGDCLRGQFNRPASRSRGRLWVVAVLILGLLAIWLFGVVRDQRRWNAYLRRLATEDGLVVVSSGREDGRWRVTGWRDPLAVDPLRVLSEFELTTNQVRGRWEPYQAVSAPFVLRRARAALRPPAGVVLSFEDGVLRAEGVAPGSWAEGVRARAEGLAGVTEFETSRLFDEAQARLSASLRRVEETVLRFGETTRLVPGQDAVVGGLVAELKSLGEAANGAGRRVRLEVVGHTDRTGTPEFNQKLSRQRAEETRALLEARGIPPAWLVVSGVGATEPLRPGMAAGDEPLNRRVTFRVRLGAAGSPPP